MEAGVKVRRERFREKVGCGFYHSNENKSVIETKASGDAKSCVCSQSDHCQDESEQYAIDVYDTGPARCWIGVIWHRPSFYSLYGDVHDDELEVERLDMV